MEAHLIQLSALDTFFPAVFECGQVDVPYQNKFKLESKTDGIVHAISLWFNMYMRSDSIPGPSNTITTGPTLCLNNTVSHYRQVAFLLDKPVSVKLGDSLEISIAVDIACGVWCSVASTTSQFFIQAI